VIVVLVIAAIAGWIAFDGRGDTIREYQGQIKDMETEIDNLREELHQVSDERNYLGDILKHTTRDVRSLDLSGVTPTRSHSLADIISDSRFWNVMPGEGELQPQDIEESYDKTLTFEVNYMAACLARGILEDITSAWESLDAKGITSLIMVDTFLEVNRVWLLVLWTKETLDTGTGWGIVIDAVTGYKYILYTLQTAPDRLYVNPESLWVYCWGYVYTSSADLRADIEGR
jgi:hypothetical protein